MPAPRTETQLWQALSPLLKREGVFAQKISDRFSSGVPDILAAVSPKGKALALELKIEEWMEVSPLQRRWLVAWQAMGGSAWILSVDKLGIYRLREVEEMGVLFASPSLRAVVNYIKGA